MKNSVFVFTDFNTKL